MSLAVPRWIGRANHRRGLHSLEQGRQVVFQQRNAILHDIIAIRRAAEREMQRVMRSEVIEGVVVATDDDVQVL